MAKTAAAVLEEQQFVLSNLSPSLAQRRLALAVALGLLVAAVITALLVLVVWKFIDWRMTPPPPPNRIPTPAAKP